MLIHILLIVMTTLQVLVTIQADTSYSRTQSRVMDRIFLTPEGETDDLSDRRERYLFNIEELQNFIKSSVENYYSLNDRLLENYNYFLDEENKIQEVEVDVVMTESKTYSLKHNYFHLNETHMGPFGLPNKELKTFLKDVEKIVLGYSFQNELPEKAAPNFNWYVWNLVQKLDFEDRSHIQVSLMHERDVWEDARKYNWGNYYWIHYWVLLLSIISLIAHWQYIAAVSQTYDKLRSKFERKNLRKSLYEGLNKQKAKIQRKNKEYRRQLSELSGPSGHQNKSGYIGETKPRGERSFLETSGISKHDSLIYFS